MKRTTLTMTLCFVLSIMVVTLLVGLSDAMKRRHDSFLRLFPAHVTEEEGSLDLVYPGYFIAGISPSHIYLGNSLYPLHVLSVDLGLTDTVHISLNIKGVEKQKFWSLKVAIRPPYFFAFDGVIPRIYWGQMSDWKGERFPYDREYFQGFEPLTDRLIGIRSIDGKTGVSMLGTISLDTPHYRFNTDILKKQVDGIFCTEGIMKYNNRRNKLYYVYRYRNGIMEIDPMLNLTNYGHTIDTIQMAKISIDTIDSEGSTTFSKPPVQVNKRIATEGNLLFVNSAVLARNEASTAHTNADVIDVYDLRDMSYRFSFYLHKYRGREEIRDLALTDNKLVVLFESHMQVYRLVDKYFEDTAL